MLSEALFSGVRGRIERRAAAGATILSTSLTSVKREPFAQHHNGSDAEDDHEEEIFVADDGTDRRHFLLARWKPCGLAQFMQARQGKLKCDDHQDRAGGSEKAAKRNLKRPLEEKEADGDGHGDSDSRADPDLKARDGEFHGTKNQDQFGALAQNHQENKKADSPPRCALAFLHIRFNALLDFFAQATRDAVHPDNHGDNENSGGEHKHALESVFTDLPALQRNSGSEAARDSNGHASPHVTRQLAAARAIEID